MSPLLYRQSVLYAELSRRCDRLSLLTEGSLSLKSRAVYFAKFSLLWISFIETKYGELDYETYVRALVDSNLLLGGLLLDSSTTAVGINGLVTSADPYDGLEVALTGLQWSRQFLEECQAARTNTVEVESARKLKEESCLRVRDMILQERKSKSLRRIGSVKMHEYHKIHQSICSETAPLEIRISQF
jgi:hypothetical protein